MTHTLLTIPISHYCERGRWALDRAGVSYAERRMPPLLHLRVARSFAAAEDLGTSLPKLRLPDGRVLRDSDAIVDHADALLGGTLSVGLTPDLRALEADLTKVLGAGVRRYLYHTMLDHPARVVPLLVDGASTFDRLAFRLLAPLALPAMRKGMNIRAETAARDRDKVHAVLDRVADQLADGRAFLHGDTFGRVDLTLASLAGPLTEVAHPPVPMSPVAALPEPLRAELLALQSHPALAHVRTCYRLERRR